MGGMVGLVRAWGVDWSFQIMNRGILEGVE